jgi:hypothetical protein
VFTNSRRNKQQDKGLQRLVLQPQANSGALRNVIDKPPPRRASARHLSRSIIIVRIASSSSAGGTRLVAGRRGRWRCGLIRAADGHGNGVVVHVLAVARHRTHVHRCGRQQLSGQIVIGNTATTGTAIAVTTIGDSNRADSGHPAIDTDTVTDTDGEGDGGGQSQARV